MTAQTPDSNAAFMEAALKKMEVQDKKLAGMEERIGNLQDMVAGIRQLSNDMAELKAGIGNMRFPAKEMQVFSGQLTKGLALLQQPPVTKVHHHIPRLVWIASGLLLVLSLTLAGWYMTGQKLEQYKAADTKYRYLQLLDSPALQRQLYRVDSLHHARPDFLWDSVIQEENARQRDYELHRKAQMLEHEAETLREKARKK